MSGAVATTFDGEGKPREVQLGPDVRLLLDGDGRLQLIQEPPRGLPRSSGLVRIPGAGVALPEVFNPRGSRVRYWKDAQGRVAQAEAF